MWFLQLMFPLKVKSLWGGFGLDEVNSSIQMHGADEQPITASPAGGGGGAWQLRSAAQPQSYRERLPVPPPACLPPLGICHTCGAASLLHAPSDRFTWLQTSAWSDPNRTEGASRLVSLSIEDAGLYGDDHYVPAVGQTEASPGSAAAAAAAEAAAHRRTRANYLPWCECIQYLTHASFCLVIIMF